MEKVTLNNWAQTEISVNVEAPYSRFLKIESGPITVRLDYASAKALHDVLAPHFTNPEVREAHAGSV